MDLAAIDTDDHQEALVLLVTGATGKSGRFFLKKAVECGYRKEEIRLILRSPSRAKCIEEGDLSIEKLYGDIDDADFLKSTMDGVDIVLHIAGILKSLSIVRAACASGVRWIILVHTTGIYSKYKEAGEGYRRIEKEIAEIARGAHLEVTILRPTMIYGTMSDNNISVFIKMIDMLKLFPVVDHAKYPLQPVHACDLGEAYYNVLLNEERTIGREYILSGDRPIMLIEILKTICKCLDRRVLFVSVPFPVAYLGAKLLCFVSLGRIDYREKVQRLVEPRAYAHEDARKDFGYAPMGFEEGLLGEIEEYKHAGR
jgi:nucleoside-diphosphate-sugar epimerase